MVQDVRVIIGDGNVGAVGIYARGAQGVSMQNVLIEAGDGLAGFAGGAGSGGSHIGVHVVGGRYGIDFTGAQPAPVATGFSSSNAKCSGLAYAGLQTLTAVGLNITMDNPSKQAPIVAGCPLPITPGCELPQVHDVQPCGNMAVSSQLSLVDSVIDVKGHALNGDRAAIRAGTALFAQGLYVRGTDVIAGFSDGYNLTVKAPAPREFTRLNAFAYGVQPPAEKPGAAQSIHSAVYIDGVNQSMPLYEEGTQSVNHPPVDLQSRHLFEGGVVSQLPDFRNQVPGAVIVQNQTLGDYLTDATAALQAAIDKAAAQGPAMGRQGLVLIPRGVYRVTRTLNLPTGVCLVGAGLELTSIVPDPSGDLKGASFHKDSTGRSRLLGAPVLLVGSDRSREQAERRGSPKMNGAVTCLARVSITVWGH